MTTVTRRRPQVAPAPAPAVAGPTYPKKPYAELLQDFIFARATAKKLNERATTMLTMLEDKVIATPSDELNELLLATYEIYNRKKTVANYNMNDESGFPIINEKTGKPESYSIEKVINPTEFRVSLVRGGSKVRIHLKDDITLTFPENAFNCKTY
jgi:hypothetical protein